jgi:hypothetical protein
MKHYKTFGVIVLALAITACNKYKNISNAQISGYVYQHDPLNNGVPVPASDVPVYLSNSDTLSYILTAQTDTAGYYAASYFTSGNGIIYSRYNANGTEYFGVKQLNGSVNGNIANVDVYPHYFNGFAVIFTTPDGGPVSNYPFRLYLNKSAAVADSVKFAYLDTMTTVNGRFYRYNVPPGTYYVTAIDSVSGHQPIYIGSFTMTSSNLYATPFKLSQ